MASDHRLAQKFDLEDVFSVAADAFPTIRVALNRISDRLMFPNRMSADRLLRQVGDAFAMG
jgi:hypothetical protein